MTLCLLGEGLSLVYDRNSFLFNIQKQIYCTQIFTENLFNRKIKYITVANRNTLIFCLFLLFPWFVSVGLSVSFLFYTNEEQKMNRKPIYCFCSVSTIHFYLRRSMQVYMSILSFLPFFLPGNKRFFMHFGARKALEHGLLRT